MTQISQKTIGSSDLQVAPLAFGGNVFGWTADRDTSFDLLDAFVEGGGDFIDTADGYSHWHPGNGGGESETIIGEWLASRGNRERVTIATKVSSHPEFKGLAGDNVRRAADASLKRLGVDEIDLYYAHHDDENAPIAETAAAFSELVTAGKVRAIALSNYTADRIADWFAVARAENLVLPVALQPHYNLMERGFETNGLLAAAQAEELSVIPYYALAEGFLTGKYRAREDFDAHGASVRAQSAARHLDDRGEAVLRALDSVSTERGVSVTAISLAWLREQPTVVAPIASARNLEQLPALLESLSVELSEDEIDLLTEASA